MDELKKETSVQIKNKIVQLIGLQEIKKFLYRVHI